MLGAILDYISRTNLFNFIIFFSIIVFICRKINLGTKLDDAKNVITQRVEDSKTEKENSEKNLKNIEDTVAHLSEEIDEIIEKSKTNAKLVGEKILEDANSLANGIRENSKKLVENKTALLKNDLLRKASEASIEVAKNHIINELNNNYELHNRLIDESVDAISEVNL